MYIPASTLSENFHKKNVIKEEITSIVNPVNKVRVAEIPHFTGIVVIPSARSPFTL